MLPADQTAGVRLQITDELRRRLPADNDVLDDPTVRIFTTIDPLVQTAVESAARRIPSTAGRFELAILVSSVRTGEVLGIRNTGNNILAVRRGSGSTLKLVVLLAAARAGLGPDTVIDGQQGCRFDSPDGVYDAAVGAATLESAPIWKMTAKSINCAFARLAEQVGPAALRQATEDLGIQPLDNLGQRFATGANTVTATELLGAMNELLITEAVVPLHLITRVERDGIALPLTDVPPTAPRITAQERSAVLRSLRAGARSRRNSPLLPTSPVAETPPARPEPSRATPTPGSSVEHHRSAPSSGSVIPTTPMTA